MDGVHTPRAAAVPAAEPEPPRTALHDYDGSTEGGLVLAPGDAIRVLELLPDGWADGANLSSGAAGVFPISYVRYY